MTPAIAAYDIRVQAREKVLLEIPSFTVSRGEWVALVGPNGAGKTTLLRTLAGDIRPDAGAVLLDGRDASTLKASELAERRAVLSQQVSVSTPFSVYEIAAMGAGLERPQDLDRIVMDKLICVGLETLADRKITTLSGGEQQRAHFARALVQLESQSRNEAPLCFFLDEPTSSLDMRHQITLLDITKRLSRRSTAVITVIHDLNLAAMFADRVVVLSTGKIAADGIPSDVVTEAVVRKVFDIANVVNQVPRTGLPYVIPHNIGTCGP